MQGSSFLVRAGRSVRSNPSEATQMGHSVASESEAAHLTGQAVFMTGSPAPTQSPPADPFGPSHRNAPLQVCNVAPVTIHTVIRGTP